MEQTLCRLNSRLILYSTIFSPKDLVEKYANKGGLKEMGFLHAFSIKRPCIASPHTGRFRRDRFLW